MEKMFIGDCHHETLAVIKKKNYENLSYEEEEFVNWVEEKERVCNCGEYI